MELFSSVSWSCRRCIILFQGNAVMEPFAILGAIMESSAISFAVVGVAAIIAITILVLKDKRVSISTKLFSLEIGKDQPQRRTGKKKERDEKD